MSNQKTILRIGNAGGYWGDDPNALLRQVSSGNLDYITMDFLAEVTMSILQKQRKRDSSLGYAKDFIDMLREAMPIALEKGTRVITNAGGVNPSACAHAIEALAKELGVKPKIAVVYGDDILPEIDSLYGDECPFTNMESGESFDGIKNRLDAANVYFGATAVVEALKSEPDIIITGRVTDTGITIAPMIYEFNWSLDDWDKIASGTIAGHLMECGAQVTGGNYTDWEKVPSFNNIGYPITEVNADGSFILTKHDSLGGLVNSDTVREQLFYEMGDPNAYLTPDVVCDFTTINLEDVGPNKVKISGVRGYEPTPLYKVSMAYTDGYKCIGEILISGAHARKKAEKFAEIFWQRCGKDFKQTETEFFGWNACHRSMGHADDGNEIILRLGALSDDRDSLRRFGKLIPSLILSGPPGVAVLGGVPRIQDVISYWPALMPKKLINPQIAIFDQELKDEKEITNCPTGNFQGKSSSVQTAEKAKQAVGKALTPPTPKASEVVVALEQICLGRSGDKGDTCNVGLIARSPEVYDFIKSKIDAQFVKDCFQELCLGKVIRYELDNLKGLNFLLEESLGGGGTHSLRVDPQGKTFSHALLRQKVAIPESLLSTIN